MAFIPSPPGTIRATFQGTLRSEACINIVHFNRPDADLDSDMLQTLANELVTRTSSLSSTGIRAFFGPQYTLEKVRTLSIAAEGGIEATSTVAGWTGSADTASMESSLALCVTMRTGLAGRSNRGRTYFGGLSQNLLTSDPNRISAVNATDIATRWINLLTAAATVIEAVPVIASFFHNKEARAIAAIPEVLAATANARLDNQRRRMPRL